MEIQITKLQAEAIWKSMSGENELGAAGDTIASAPKAPECRAILESIFDRVPYVNLDYIKIDRETISDFFIQCGQALLPAAHCPCEHDGGCCKCFECEKKRECANQ